MKVADFRQRVQAARPLVFHVTNVVTVGDCANATLFAGALPVMANSPQEAAQMVEMAQALVLNIGTLYDEQIKAMLLAGSRASELGIPIVLDPVGAGATAYRTQTALELLRALRVCIVKGNAGEIATLAGEEAEVRGVESGHIADIVGPAQALSAATGAVVAVTGARDLVVSRERMDWVDGGSDRMKTFVGSGCVAASLIGCFVGASPEHPHEATVAALAFYRGAARRAAERTPVGPVAYRDALYTELAELDAEDV